MMVGNFIADAVKGKKYLEYEEEISKGIIMHREIDTFTDSHEIVSHSKRFFRSRYGLFSSVLIDLFYDHFLAKNWNTYSEQSLSSFADHAYHVFEKYLSIMPDRNRMMFPYMQRKTGYFTMQKSKALSVVTGMSKE
jgi:acyl carrier protein phosphodiesterase